MAEFETIDENKLGAAAEKFECKLDQSERTQLDQDLREALERDRLMVGDVSNVCQTGGLIFDDPKMLDIQRRIVWDAVKTLGWNIMAGNTVNIISVSLPVRIFEPRSFLGRLSDGWSCAPILLRKAALQTDPVERFKYVIAFAIAGLHVNIRQWKPFNPILGETLQSTFPDGTQVYLEQTSHHPPVSHYQVFGADGLYKLHGCAQFAASWRGNALKASQSGPNIVEFSDGTSISYTLPYLWLSGVLYGDRVSEYLGQMTIRDEQNNISCEVVFHPDGVGYLKSWFVSSPSPSDTFRGDIIKDGNKVDQIDGSWIGEIRSNGVVLYDVRQKLDASTVPAENPIPSDSRFREDLKALSEGKFDLAQAKKVELEELQRSDRALRRQGYEQRESASSDL